MNAGKLLIGTGGSLGNTAVTVGGALANGTPVLGGGGTIGGATVISEANGGAAGTHAIGIPGVASGVGTQTFSSTLTYGSGSIFEWDLIASTVDPGANEANSGSYDRLIANGAAGSVSGMSAVFNIVLGGNSFATAFWDTHKSWTDIFTGPGTPTNLGVLFSSFSGSGIEPSGLVSGRGQFSFNGTSTLTWTAVPEPTNALAGVLLGAGLLRRRRR